MAIDWVQVGYHWVWAAQKALIAEGSPLLQGFPFPSGKYELVPPTATFMMRYITFRCQKALYPHVPPMGYGVKCQFPEGLVNREAQHNLVFGVYIRSDVSLVPDEAVNMEVI